MKIKVLEETPRKVLEFPLDNDLNLTEKEVEDVAEIFKTPLTGSYNWDYTIQDNRIKRLYELGKELNWNVERILIGINRCQKKKTIHLLFSGMNMSLTKSFLQRINSSFFNTGLPGLLANFFMANKVHC